MGRDTKTELQKCLRHNTAMHAKIEAQDTEIEGLRAEVDHLLGELLDAQAKTKQRDG